MCPYRFLPPLRDGVLTDYPIRFRSPLKSWYSVRKRRRAVGLIGVGLGPADATVSYSRVPISPLRGRLAKHAGLRYISLYLVSFFMNIAFLPMTFPFASVSSLMIISTFSGHP